MEELRENSSLQPVLLKWKLRDEKGKPVGTFIPRVMKEIRICTPEGDMLTKAARLLLEFSDGQNVEVTLALDEVEKADWCRIDGRCIVNSNYRRARAFIANSIRAGLHDVPVEIQYRLDRLGIHHIEDTIVFAAGNRVITQSSVPETGLRFDLSRLPFQLDIDKSISEEEAIKGMLELMCISPEVGRVLVAHVISGIARAAFLETGFTPCAVLVIVGESGMLKSHYIPQLAQIYDRDSGIKADTRFNSSKSFIEKEFCKYSECTFVVDDLHTAEARGIRRKNEETAEEMIRRIGDDTGRGHMEGYAAIQEQFRGNIVFIGEYTIGRASTVPREFVINMKKRPDGAVLDKYQRKKPLLVSTFYYFFIQWYVNHFEEIKRMIDEQLTRLREETAQSDTHGRLQDTQFYLKIAYTLFVDYCKDSGFCNQKDALQELEDFCSQLAVLTAEQQNRFKVNSTNYLKLVKQLYQGGRFCVASNNKVFDPNRHDGLICYSCLCLRGKCLEQAIKKVNASFNLEDCIYDLLAKDALKLVKNKNTVQVSGTGGKRFYAIKLSKLV